jgi:hypothetical protein
MLIEFRVANHRSFREEQALSMVAVNRDHSLEATHVIDPKIKGAKDLRLLRSIALCGANASGKTNVIRALDFMRAMVVGSAQHQESARLNFRPFMLDEDSRKAPTRFEVTFLHEEIRYQYGFEFNEERIQSEWLHAYPSGLPRTYFERDASKEQEYEFGPLFKGEKHRLTPLTRPNALFLSVAAQFNHPELTPVFVWFRDMLNCLMGTGDRFDLVGYTIERSHRDPAFLAKVVRMLESSDTGISDFQVERAKMPPVEIEDPRTRVKLKFGGEDQEGYKFNLFHRAQGKAVSLPFEDESLGTHRILAYAGPFIDVLERGATIVVDELEQSLHPLLVLEILRLFHSPETNPKGAQILFTTHLPLLLDQEQIRRDQVWFTEKANSGATTLFPLTDFKPRTGKYESILKGYLSGRYGAVPVLRELLG